MYFFYDELGHHPILNRKTKKPTCDGEALAKLGRRDPLISPICEIINKMRSLLSSRAVCMQPTDSDGRMRTDYIVGGTETLRFASKENAFGYGGNLQNITSGDEAHDDYQPKFPLPNLRRLLIPDPGYTIGEFDLEQADARIVAAEARDEALLDLFADPTRDLHNENCEAIYGRCSGKGDPNRQLAKTGVHLTNYGGTPPVLAASLGISIREAKHFQVRWFSLHPAIREWHRRILSELQSRRYVQNVYGYRRFYFDRIDGVLKEALAWIPQSTVAITVNLGIRAVDRDVGLRAADVQFLLQVHDSAGFQWPTKVTSFVIPRIHKHVQVRVPYSPSLVIPAAIKSI